MRLVRMDAEFFIFVVVGFVAQLIDGALGMAFGVVSATVLLTFGFSPAHASAIVHTAEVFTTGASAASHAIHRNINRFRVFSIDGLDRFASTSSSPLQFMNAWTQGRRG